MGFPKDVLQNLLLGLVTVLGPNNHSKSAFEVGCEDSLDWLE
jgi:hypothetical protein